MVKLFKILLFIGFLFFVNYSFSQNRVRRTNNFKSYRDHINEIGFTSGMSYLKYEANFAPYLYLHYSHKFNSFLSLGIGNGSVYDEHFHNTVNLETAFRLSDEVSICFKPGLAYKNISDEHIWLFCMGIELVYEYKITDVIHLGPLAEVNFIQDDTNFMFGIHMGFTY